MPEVIAYLNGVIVHGVFSLKNLIVKFIALIFATSSGLPTATQGPIIALGLASNKNDRKYFTDEETGLDVSLAELSLDEVLVNSSQKPWASNQMRLDVFVTQKAGEHIVHAC